MSRRTIENCKVIKSAKQEGLGKPLTETVNNKAFCQGYQKSECDDEPYSKCMNCHLNIFYQNQ
jgi:hypothetical protein